MQIKERIKQVLRRDGLTKRSWARKLGFNEYTVLSFFKLYTDSESEPRGDIFKRIDDAFYKDFGFNIYTKKMDVSCGNTTHP